jgi:hypothetical protein
VNGHTSSGVDDLGTVTASADAVSPAERTLASVFAELDDLDSRISEHRRRVRESRDHPRSA